MRVLHVAALPFPSPQGTQGAIHQMLSALALHGHEAHLLCYAHGGRDEPRPYAVHRAPTRFPGRSLRSGPSLEKLRLDLGLARALRRLVDALAPDAVVAHHVEAMLCALAVGAQPALFVAHTSLRHELPTYFPAVSAALFRALGGQLDVQLVRRAARAAAVSPMLAGVLTRESGRSVGVLPPPWPIPPPISVAERRAARRVLALAPDAEVLLYAGNFDAYQGLAPMLDGIALLAPRRPALRLLIATEAPHAAIMPALKARGLRALVQFASLVDERARRLVHAAADLSLAPRKSAGGVPIKLLDALARGVPVLGPRRAFAGFSFSPAPLIVAGDDGAAWFEALHSALVDRASTLASLQAAQTALADELAGTTHVRALTEQVGALKKKRAGTLSATTSRQGAERG